MTTLKQAVTPKMLKDFGVVMAWAFPLFIGIIAPWIFGKNMQWWALWVGVCFLSLAITSPKLLLYPFKAWMFIGGIFGFINTRIILGVTFYGLIFPIGIILKLLGKQQFKKSTTEQSNYIKRTDKITKAQLENPF